jgi:hypothetical protein
VIFLAFLDILKTCVNESDGVAIATMSLAVAITEITVAIRHSTPKEAYQQQSGWYAQMKEYIYSLAKI